jgi:hypothetical protein
MGTQLVIKDALLYPGSKQTLLSFKDICSNGFHVETEVKHKTEYLLMTTFHGSEKKVAKKLPSLASGLYYIYIKPIKEYIAMKTNFRNPESYRIWHDRLGHPGLGMMRKIINGSIGHNIATKEFPNPEDFMCTACAKGKLILRPSTLKVKDESPIFMSRQFSCREFKVIFVEQYSPYRALLGTLWS